MSYRPYQTVVAYASGASPAPSGDYVGSLLASRAFVRDFFPNAVNAAYVKEHTALFTRTGWSELPREWTRVLVDR